MLLFHPSECQVSDHSFYHWDHLRSYRIFRILAHDGDDLRSCSWRGIGCNCILFGIGDIVSRTESKVQLVTKFVISIVGLSTGVGFMFYLIAIGIATNARFDSGLYMGAIQAWMTFKWSASWIAHLSHHHRLSEDRIQEEWEEDEEERKPLNESSIV